MMNKHFDNFEEAQEAVRKTKGGKVKRDPKGGFIVEFKSASSPTVIPLDESPPTVAQGDESSPSVIPEDEDTVRIVAEPRHRDFQATFIESLALPSALLEKANLDPSLRAWLLQDAKWRIDFPRKAKHTVSKEFRAALSIAQKILLRGNLTLLSPSLEQELVEKSQSNADAIGAMNLTGMHLGLTQPYPFDLQQLEGEGSEEAFYRDIVPGIIGANFQRFVFPQLYIRSLVKGLSEKSPLHAQRVDFYINTGDRKCVVEIDGPEHEEDKENDDKRDRAFKAG